MSLAIEPDDVKAICVAGEWLTIDREGGGFFGVDAYEYIEQWENPPGHWKQNILYGGGAGFVADTVERGRIFGPMTALTAVAIEYVRAGEPSA